jgi:sulfate transport system ATP-binding protein
VSLEARQVTKRYGGFLALDRVDLKVETGELVALLGPSGSGKTSLLRILAGLDLPESGEVLVDGAPAGRDPRERGVGFVFQHYALFRHMSVFENVAFGLRARPKSTRPDEREIKRRVDELLDLVQLDFLADRLPAALSGGQRQRVALARALAVEPRTLLLDEPFGSLDARVRRELRRWLRRFHDTVRLTSVFVTHDQDVALEVADRVAVLNAGRIEQIGTPEEVFERPATPFVMRFLGSVNVFHGREFVRPHELAVHRTATAGAIAATLRRASPAGALVRLDLEGDEGETIEAEVPRETWDALGARSGERLWVSPRAVRLFVE